MVAVNFLNEYSSLNIKRSLYRHNLIESSFVNLNNYNHIGHGVSTSTTSSYQACIGEYLERLYLFRGSQNKQNRLRLSNQETVLLNSSMLYFSNDVYLDSCGVGSGADLNRAIIASTFSTSTCSNGYKNSKMSCA